MRASWGIASSWGLAALASGASALLQNGTVCANTAQEGFCATLDDDALVKTWAAALGKPWSDPGTYGKLFGMAGADDNALLSALDAAKVWIVTTDGLPGPPELVGSGAASSGGCGSCAAAVAVALQEGGNQASPAAVVPPSQVPRDATDPTFSTSLLCRDGEKCASGGIWQVSNAWTKNSTECLVCEQVGCHSIKNPLCAARIALEWTHADDNRTNIPCKNATDGSLAVCKIEDLQNGPDPNCMLGPFCLGSDGWNSPPCEQMYRQASATNGALPFCRLALDACAAAVTQLQAAGWTSKVAGSCEPPAMRGIVDHACAGHTAPGDWAMPACGKQKGECTCAGKPCLLPTATDDDDAPPTPPPPPPPTPPTPPTPPPTPAPTQGCDACLASGRSWCWGDSSCVAPGNEWTCPAAGSKARKGYASCSSSSGSACKCHSCDAVKSEECGAHP
jgi:hypothetical protein